MVYFFDWIRKNEFDNIPYPLSKEFNVDLYKLAFKKTN
jgi:hypothetical protein